MHWPRCTGTCGKSAVSLRWRGASLLWRQIDHEFAAERGLRGRSCEARLVIPLVGATLATWAALADWIGAIDVGERRRRAAGVAPTGAVAIRVLDVGIVDVERTTKARASKAERAIVASIATT